MNESAGGRVFEPELTAVAAEAGAHIELRSPAVGLWREAPAPGTLVRPGDAIGRLEILSVLHRVVAPPGAQGMVLAADEAEAEAGAALARRPLGHGQRMLVLDPAATAGAAASEAPDAAAVATPEGLAFRAPTGGRFYSRPSPDRPSFVSVGDEIEHGRAVCLLEVMKTFNRVTYGGKGMPARARVKAIVPADEADLAAGDVILLLEEPD